MPTSYLIAEHEKISSMLRVLERMCARLKQGESLPVEHWESLFRFFELFSDQIHHAKEEDILLPALIQSGFPWKGGPMCSHFKQIQMQMLRDGESMQEQVAALNREFGLNILFDADPFSDRRSLPVLDEHVLGRALVRVLRLQLGKTSFISFAHRFIALLDAHIDKENRCLFPMLNDTFNVEQQKEMLQKFLEADKKFFMQVSFQELEEQWKKLLILY